MISSRQTLAYWALVSPLIKVPLLTSSEPIPYLHEYGFYKYNGENDAVIQDGDWHLATVEEMEGLKEDFIAYYNLNGGLKAIDTFDSNSCCIRTGNSWLVIREHDLCPHDSVTGYTAGQLDKDYFYYFSETTSPYEDLLPLYMNDTFTDDDEDAAECGHVNDNAAVYFRYRYGLYDINAPTDISDAGWELATLEEVEDDRYFFEMFYNTYGGIPVIDSWDALSHAMFWDKDGNDQFVCNFNQSDWQIFTADVNGSVDSDYTRGHIQKFLLADINGDGSVINDLNSDYDFLATNSFASYDAGLKQPALYTRGQTWIGYTWPPTTSPTLYTVGPTSNTVYPSQYPTTYPTLNPTRNPTGNPTGNPTKNPTESPSSFPSKSPTMNPTRSTGSPSRPPTMAAATTSTTPVPTSSPTESPVESVGIGVGDDDDGNELSGGSGSGALLNTTGWVVLGILALTVLCCLICCFCAWRRRDLDKKNRKIDKLKKELRNERKANFANEMDDMEMDMDLRGVDMQAGRGPSLIPVHMQGPRNTMDTVGPRGAGFSAADGAVAGGAAAAAVGAVGVANGGRGKNDLFLPSVPEAPEPMDTNAQAVSLLLAGQGGAQGVAAVGGAGGFVQMSALNGAVGGAAAQPVQLMVVDQSGRLISVGAAGGAIAVGGAAAAAVGASAVAAPGPGGTTDTAAHHGEGKHPVEEPKVVEYITPHDDDDHHEFEAAPAHGEDDSSDEPSLMLAKEGAGYLSGTRALSDDGSGVTPAASEGGSAMVTGSVRSFESADSKRQLMAYSMPDSRTRLYSGKSDEDEDLYE